MRAMAAAAGPQPPGVSEALFANHQDGPAWKKKLLFRRLKLTRRPRWRPRFCARPRAGRQGAAAGAVGAAALVGPTATLSPGLRWSRPGPRVAWAANLLTIRIPTRPRPHWCPP